MSRLYYSENQRIDTRSGTVEYLLQGEGLPILYFHGTGAGNEVVVPMEQRLLDSGFRLIVPNRPGYYGTPLNNRGSASSCAKMAAELLEFLGIEKVAVIGTSGGGPPASRFASEFPDNTVCLVLQCAESHRWDKGKWLPKGIRWALPIFKVPIIRPFLRFYTKWLCQRGLERVEDCIKKYSGDRFENLGDEQSFREFVPHLLEASLNCSRNPAGIENDWDIFLSKAWIQPGTVHVPTLVIHDRQDPVVPFAHAEWAAQCIEKAKLLEVNAAGHMIWYGEDAEKMHLSRTDFMLSHFGITG